MKKAAICLPNPSGMCETQKKSNLQAPSDAQERHSAEHSKTPGISSIAHLDNKNLRTYKLKTNESYDTTSHLTEKVIRKSIDLLDQQNFLRVKKKQSAKCFNTERSKSQSKASKQNQVRQSIIDIARNEINNYRQDFCRAKIIPSLSLPKRDQSSGEELANFSQILSNKKSNQLSLQLQQQLQQQLNSQGKINILNYKTNLQIGNIKIHYQQNTDSVQFKNSPCYRIYQKILNINQSNNVGPNLGISEQQKRDEYFKLMQQGQIYSGGKNYQISSQIQKLQNEQRKSRQERYRNNPDSQNTSQASSRLLHPKEQKPNQQIMMWQDAPQSIQKNDYCQMQTKFYPSPSPQTRRVIVSSLSKNRRQNSEIFSQNQEKQYNQQAHQQSQQQQQLPKTQYSLQQYQIQPQNKQNQQQQLQPQHSLPHSNQFQYVKCNTCESEGSEILNQSFAQPVYQSVLGSNQNLPNALQTQASRQYLDVNLLKNSYKRRIQQQLSLIYYKNNYIQLILIMQFTVRY